MIRMADRPDPDHDPTQPPPLPSVAEVAVLLIGIFGILLAIAWALPPLVGR